MDLSALFKRVGKVAADNSPAILSAIGVTGTLSAAYLAAKGAFQASEVIREAQAEQDEAEQGHPLTTQEKFDLTWKLYVPAAACVVLSATAIICANRISDRRTAALASAYSVVEKSYNEYRTKTTEKVGKKKEQEIRDDIAQDRRDAHPITKTTLVVNSKGDTLCYDMWTDRYFTSDMESLRKAMNDFNQQVINDTYQPLSEWYHLVGLPSTSHSDEIGWDTDKLMDLDFSGTLSEDGTPCIAVDFRVKPNPRFSTLY